MRGKDNNGDNDNHFIATAALAEYLNLWHTNPYGSGGDESVLSLGSSLGQYASLGWAVPWQQGQWQLPARCHQAFAMAINATCNDCRAMQQSTYKKGGEVVA